MTQNEINWLIGICLFGMICGILSGAAAAKKSSGFEGAFISALLYGLFLPLIFCFVFGFSKAQHPDGFTINHAIISGLGATVFIGIGVVVFTLPTSVLFSLLTHTVLLLYFKKRKKAQKAVSSDH